MRFTPVFRSPADYPVFLAISFLVLIFLPTWNCTMELEDIKYIAAFIFFPHLLFFAERHSSKGTVPATPLTARAYWLLFFAFVAYMLCNWYFLSSPYYGTRSMVYLWFCFLSFLLGVFFLSQPKKFTAFCVVCSIVGVIASFYSFGEYTALIPYYNPEAWPPRITGLFAHKNAFAFFIMNSSIVTSYFIFRSYQKKIRGVLIATLLIQLFALFISDCRGVLALTTLGFLGIFIPMSIKSGILKNPKGRYVLYAIFFLCMMIPLFVWDDYFWLRVANLALSTGGEVTTRQALYSAEWKLFFAHPLFGCGIGNFVFENIPFWPESFRKLVVAFFFARNAESDFLETLTETGLIGFAFYCFFLFGAVLLGIRELRRKWKWETYVVLVLFFLMLCNGIYDTALRRLPCAIIFWSYAGYLWRNCFITEGRQHSSKIWFWGNASAFLVHCMLAVFFLRILAGDFFYQQSYVTKKNPLPQSGKQIARTLAICPFHPDALYQAAYIGLRTKEYDYTSRLIDRLEQTAPHYRPTSFLKGLCATEQGRNADALSYANEEIRKNPNCLDPSELKVKALAGLGICVESSHLKDSLCEPLKDEIAFIRRGDTTSSSTLTKNYLDQTGKIRAWMGGSHLKEAYRRYTAINRNIQENYYAQLHRISKIPCEARQ
jgi:O-antigen ligase